ESGDTLSGVARKYGDSVAALKQANGIEDGNIRIGQTLRIPGATTPVVAEAKPVAPKMEEAKPAPVLKAETPKAAQPQETEKPKLAAYTPPTSLKAVTYEARVEAEALDDTVIGKMCLPVMGRVISGVGKGSGNARDGIDI